MSLVTAYERIKPSVVAFCPSYLPVQEGVPPPLFHPIIGTGFVVREDGVIITNQHVVDAFSKQFRPPGLPTSDWGVFALLLHMTEHGQVELRLRVLGAAMIGKFDPGPTYYGPKKLDLAFVHVNARGLSTARLAPEKRIAEGIEVATAGFPMGSDALTAPGHLIQVTPTLQRGIVSAVLPFACDRPQGFTINVMVQGGASGSPVFDPETGEVLGVLYGSLNDIGVTASRDVYSMPTNISYVVPGHYVHACMRQINANPEIKLPDDAPSIEKMLEGKRMVNVLEEGQQFEVRQINYEDGAPAASPITPEIARTRDDEGSDAGE